MLLPLCLSDHCVNQCLPSLLPHFFFLLHFLVDFADDFMVFKGPNHIAEMLLSMGRVLLIDNLH